MYDNFCVSVHHHAQQLLRANPRILFQEFMRQMSEYFSIENHVDFALQQSRQIRDEHMSISKKVESLQAKKMARPLAVHIIGAGPAGLLLAKALINDPVTIHVYEKRPINNSTSRLQLIGIRNARFLLDFLNKEDLQELLKYGGQHDLQADILRIPIAGLQLCIRHMIQQNVIFHYGHTVSPIELGQSLDHNSNIIVVASGKSLEKSTATLFEQDVFSDYQGVCRYTWLLRPSHDAYFSNRLMDFSHGPEWVRTHRTHSKRDSLLRYYEFFNHHSTLDPTSKLLVDALKNLSSPYVVLTTIVSTDKTNFSSHSPITSEDITVVPSICKKQINRHPVTQEMPYILLGDITGQTHPLSLSGMTKIIRVIPALKSLILNYDIYRDLKTLIPKPAYEKYRDLIDLEFEKTALGLRDYVFFKTLVCLLFEKAAGPARDNKV